MVSFFLRLMSWLPLSWLYGLGAFGGRMVYRFDQKYAQRLAQNASQAGYVTKDFWLKNASESGRGGAELAYLWSDEVTQLLPQIKVSGWEAVEQLRAQGRGMVMLTPHMGAFELLSLWIGQRVPFMAMYRQPKFAEAEAVMLAGRERLGVQMATADLKGVRMLLRHLKQGHVVGLLPDQVPSGQGEFVLADWFGRPAKTMTLPVKLLHQAKAGLVVMFAKRVDAPHRFELYFEVVDVPDSGDITADVQTINAHMERLIRMAPEQYLWNYNRYKGAPEVEPEVASQSTTQNPAEKQA